MINEMRTSVYKLIKFMNNFDRFKETIQFPLIEVYIRIYIYVLFRLFLFSLLK